MGRKKLDDGKRVTICAKVSEADIARIDGARGDLTRSAWVQRAIGIVLGTVPLAAALPADVAATAATAATPSGAVHPARRAAQGDECPHPKARIAKGLCNACGTYVGKA